MLNRLRMAASGWSPKEDEDDRSADSPREDVLGSVDALISQGIASKAGTESKPNVALGEPAGEPLSPVGTADAAEMAGEPSERPKTPLSEGDWLAAGQVAAAGTPKTNRTFDRLSGDPLWSPLCPGASPRTEDEPWTPATTPSTKPIWTLAKGMSSKFPTTAGEHGAAPGAAESASQQNTPPETLSIGGDPSAEHWAPGAAARTPESPKSVDMVLGEPGEDTQETVDEPHLLRESGAAADTQETTDEPKLSPKTPSELDGLAGEPCTPKTGHSKGLPEPVAEEVDTSEPNFCPKGDGDLPGEPWTHGTVAGVPQTPKTLNGEPDVNADAAAAAMKGEPADAAAAPSAPEGGEAAEPPAKRARRGTDLPTKLLQHLDVLKSKLDADADKPSLEWARDLGRTRFSSKDSTAKVWFQVEKRKDSGGSLGYVVCLKAKDGTWTAQLASVKTHESQLRAHALVLSGLAKVAEEFTSKELVSNGCVLFKPLVAVALEWVAGLP